MGSQIIKVGPPRPGPEAVYEPPPQSEDVWKVERPAPDDPEEKKVATELRTRFTEWQSADFEFLKNSEFELDFLAGGDGHWIEEENGTNKAVELRGLGRSAFTIDLLGPSVDLVVNQIRINKLTANFIPLGGGADQATADIRQGLYRNIDRVSKAAIARETAYQFAVSVGRGYERVIIEDEDGATFNKRIGIQRVDNLKSIAVDPTCLDFTYADMGWAFAFEDVWNAQFEAEYGFAPAPMANELGADDDTTRNIWFPKDKTRIGEYWRRVWRKREVWKLLDGTDVWSDEAPEEYRSRDGFQPKLLPVKVKTKLDSTIEWRKMTGVRTLEKRVWPGKFIPIVVFVGREVFRGKRPKIHSGIVRPAIDPSRIHDFMQSRAVDEVALSPLPHFLEYEGTLSPEDKRLVNSINSKPWSVVTMKILNDGSDRLVTSPGWVSPAANTSATVQAVQGAKDNLERVLNIYAPQRGAQVGDSSGKAINAVKDSGDQSHAAFPDNYARAIDQEARIVNDLMDYVYTDKQAITITEPDDKTKQILINQEYEDAKTGKIKLHIFGSGASYGVSTIVGASSPSQAAERLQMLLNLAKEFAPQFANTLDLIIADMGVPNASKYQDRLRPPNFHDDEDGPTMAQVQGSLQQSQQQLQQADQIIAHFQELLKKANDSNEIKRLEILSKLKIAAASDRAGIIEAQVRAGEQTAASVLLMELEHILQQSMDDATDPEEPKDDSAPKPATPGPLNAGPAANGAPAPPAGLPPGMPPGAPTQ